MDIRQGCAHPSLKKFEDIQLIPAKCIVNSRSECDTSVTLGGHKFKLPVVPANMQTIIDESIAAKLAENGYFYIMHRFNPETRISFIKDMQSRGLIASISVGVKDEERRLFPENVLLLPRTNQTAELAQLYTMADVFVNPTLQETQGLTNLEALACGTGVITFKSGGSPEGIDESCGFVVEREDFIGLFNAVIQVCKNPFETEQCLRRASLFDKSKLYQDYLNLYEAAIRRNGVKNSSENIVIGATLSG